MITIRTKEIIEGVLVELEAQSPEHLAELKQKAAQRIRSGETWADNQGQEGGYAYDIAK